MDMNPLAEVRTVQVGAPPHGQVMEIPLLGQVWVLNTGDDTVSRLDGTTGDDVGAIKLDGTPLRGKPDKAAGVVYLLLEDGRVAVLDMHTGDVVQMLEIPGRGQPTCFVALPWTDRLCAITYGGLTHVMDTATREWVDEIQTGSGSVWGTPQVASSYGKLHVVNELSNDVTVVDEATNDVIATVPVGKRPVRNITYPLYGAVYVANADDGTVSAIDIASDQVVATIPVGVRPGRMAVTQKNTGRDAVWVLNRGSESRPAGRISILDGNGHAVVRTVEVCANPFQWKFEGPRVYVVSGTEREITVLDEGSAAVIGRIPLSRDPDLTADNVLKGGSRGLFVVNSDDSLTIYEPAA